MPEDEAPERHIRGFCLGRNARNCGRCDSETISIHADDAVTIPVTLKRIDHVLLRMRDPEASLHFYRDVLGCTLDKVQEQIDLWQVRAGD